jgi:hypothetical protein
MRERHTEGRSWRPEEKSLLDGELKFLARLMTEELTVCLQIYGCTASIYAHGFEAGEAV